MDLFVIIPVVIVVLYLLNSIKILAEYERGVIFRLGRLLGSAKGPGLILVFAPIDRIVRVSLRQVVLEVPPQDIITRDNVTLKVNAVIFLRVIEPNQAVVAVENYLYQTSQFAQTTLRSVLGEVDLDELLAHRDKINTRLQSILDQHTGPVGREGHQCRSEAGRFAGDHDARHGEAGRGRARKAVEDHSCRRRIRGGATLGGCGASVGDGAHQYSIAVPADADGNRRREEYDHHLPGSGGPVDGFAEVGAGRTRQRRKAPESPPAQ